MAYITSDDFKGFLDERELAALKRDTEADGTDKMPICIAYAENYVSDRLGKRYDMAAEYAKTGTNRNTTLIEILIHIAIWKLGATFPTIQIDGKRHLFYQEALDNLKRAEKGQILNGLPVNEPTASGIQYGTSQQTDVIY